MSSNSENNSKKYFGIKIFTKVKSLLISNTFFFGFLILYILIVAGVSIREFIASSFRATDQFLALLGFLFIPTLLILALVYVVNNYNNISLIFGDKEIKLKEKIKKEVTAALVENLTTSTESTVYSLASFVIVEQDDNSIHRSNYLEEPRDDPNQIIVGCQDYTEQYILCAIITKLLRNHKYTVIPKYNFGGVGLNFIALSRGDIDIYPAYTWQGLEMVYGTSLLQRKSPFTKANEPNEQEAGETIEKLNQMYERLSIPLEWICYTGFYDNWNIVVREDYGKEQGIDNISDLAIKNQNLHLKLGCEYDFFSRPNGYNLLTNLEPNGYGINFEQVILIKHKDAYEALKNKEVDVIDGFDTDPEKDDKKDGKKLYRKLEDDQKRFGRYYSSILARKEILERNDPNDPNNNSPTVNDPNNRNGPNNNLPTVRAILRELENKIKAEDISKMIATANKNYNIGKIEDMAKNFLKEKNLI